MDPEQELAAAIADRAHWRREGRAAIYGPGTPATVRVLPIAQPSRRERFAAVILRGGRAKHTLPCDTAKQAVLL